MHKTTILVLKYNGAMFKNMSDISMRLEVLLLWLLFLISITESRDDEVIALTPYLVHINDLPNVAHFQDAEHRGPAWYDYSARSKESASDLESGISSISDAEESKDSTASDTSSDASSQDTKERRKVTDLHRACTACPHEMLKNFKNIGIKWICGGYQRARRSFKSECMMRFRNCQDGTMFVKLSEHKCGASGRVGNASLNYHGKHWFYHYKV